MAEQEAAPKAAAKAASPPRSGREAAPVGLLGGCKAWVVHEGPWWLCSFVFHLAWSVRWR